MTTVLFSVLIVMMYLMYLALGLLTFIIMFLSDMLHHNSEDSNKISKISPHFYIRKNLLITMMFWPVPLFILILDGHVDKSIY